MRVVLVSDHLLLRRGLRELLSVRGMEVLGDFSLCCDALELVCGLAPQVLMLICSETADRGLALLKAWKARGTGIPVLMISMSTEQARSGYTVPLEADGFLSRDSDPEELVEAVGCLLSGGNYLPSDVSTITVPESNKPLRLTKTEAEVLRQVGTGATLADLSRHFVVSRNTAKTHLHNLYRKFGVSDRVQLLMKARDLGLL